VAIEIHETIVSPDVNGIAVQILISDEPQQRADEAKFRVTLDLRLSDYDLPLVAQIQRAAIGAAMDELRAIYQSLGVQINNGSGHYNLDPTVKK